MNVNFRRKAKNGKMTMQSKLWKMILIVALPLMIVIILIASIGIGYALQYQRDPEQRHDGIGLQPELQGRHRSENVLLRDRQPVFGRPADRERCSPRRRLREN